MVDFYSYKYMPSIFNLYWDMGLIFLSSVKNKNVHYVISTSACYLECSCRLALKKTIENFRPRLPKHFKIKPVFLVT